MRILRSIVVILAAIALLTAGVLLPDLLLNRSMNSKLDNVEYITTDELHPYGGAFYETQERLTTLADHYKEIELMGEYYGGVELDGIVAPSEEPMTDDPMIEWEYDGAPSSLMTEYDTAFTKLLKFTETWNKDLHESLEKDENILYQRMYTGEGWEIFIVEFLSFDQGLYGQIAFDAQTGLPVDIIVSVEYTSTLRLEKLWTSYVESFENETHIEFLQSSNLIPDFGPNYNTTVRAISFDGSVTLCCDSEINDDISGTGYILHFYLE